MPLYTVDIKLCATAYIKADNPEAALEIAKSMRLEGFEISPDEDLDLPITDRMLDDPNLPDVSLSPSFTNYGPFDETTTAQPVG